MADDLGEEWWLDDADRKTVSEDDENKKREAEDSEEERQSDEEKEQLETGTNESADKRKKKQSKRRKITEELAKEKPIPPTAQDLISVLMKYFQDKLSPVEIDELILEDENFVACNDLSHTPVSYLKSVMPKWKKMMKSSSSQKGAPLLLIVCSSALRAAQLNRDVADFKGEECKSIKLFAKHIKVREQIKLLEKSVVHFGIGTPNRILSLIEQGGLHLDQTSHVIIDWTWRDIKSRRLIDISEIKTDLFKLIQRHLIPRCSKGLLKIGLL